VFTFQADGRPSGEAYVELPSEDAAQQAMKKHKETLGSRWGGARGKGRGGVGGLLAGGLQGKRPSGGRRQASAPRRTRFRTQPGPQWPSVALTSNPPPPAGTWRCSPPQRPTSCRRSSRPAWAQCWPRAGAATCRSTCSWRARRAWPRAAPAASPACPSPARPSRTWALRPSSGVGRSAAAHAGGGGWGKLAAWATCVWASLRWMALAPAAAGSAGGSGLPLLALQAASASARGRAAPAAWGALGAPNWQARCRSCSTSRTALSSKAGSSR
jgi:hypothetical protein